MKPISLATQKKLLRWYNANQRKLPWRETKDAYPIWISEVMLQQTTVKAVIPYYEKFLQRFPNVKILANASIEDIYEYWAGLGYYSRARNLHKAAAQIAKNGFPKTHQKLMELSGFGPYTARAVASFAFKDSAGVLDGNVIRFLSRFHNLKVHHWENSGRKELQSLSDRWVQKQDSSQINQALIEIGATVCTPQNPACLLCPIRAECKAYCLGTQNQLPLKKPRRNLEIWIWEPNIFLKKSQIALTKNTYAPFLKGQLIFPGKVQKSNARPKTFHYKHTITHHEIYVRLKKTSKDLRQWKNLVWVKIDHVKKISPVSLIQKALAHL